MKHLSFLLVLFFFSLNLALGNSSPTKKPTVVVIPIDKDIDMGITYFLKRAISSAEAKKPDYILFEINTFGGRLDAAFEIVDLITNIKCCSTMAFVEKKAISAGALIALASNKIAMGKGTTIGDCAPIIQSQQGIVMAGEKIESPLRAKFRNLAERNGYPSLLAQAMVSIEMEVVRAKRDGKWVYMNAHEWDELENPSLYTNKQTLVKSGELLTLTDKEAQEHGFSVGSFENLDDLIQKNGWERLKKIESSWSESLVRLIEKFSPLLLLIGFGALYMEFKTPGFGLFGITGIAALVIVFGSKYAVGLANYTELLILALGILLIVVEMFIFPGTFLFGLAGVLCFITALVLSFQGFTLPDPNLPWEKNFLLSNLAQVMGWAFAGLLFPLVLARYVLPLLPGRKSLYLSTTLKDSHISKIDENLQPIEIGEEAFTQTDLRPYGKIKIQNRSLEAHTDSGYIAMGTPVVVTRVEGNRITVRVKGSP